MLVMGDGQQQMSSVDVCRCLWPSPGAPDDCKHEKREAVEGVFVSVSLTVPSVLMSSWVQQGAALASEDYIMDSQHRPGGW